MLQTSNPALSSRTLGQTLGSIAHVGTASVGGVVTKTAIFLGIATAVGGFGYVTVQNNPPAMIWINLVAMVVTLGVYFGVRARPQAAMVLGFIYAAAEGFLLGGVAAMLDLILVQSGKGLPGGIALSAALLTAGVTTSMLLLYASRIVKPSNTLAMVLSSATMGIMFVYLIAFAVSWLAPSYSHYFSAITLQSAMEGGRGAWIGLGVNVLILLVAAFWLVIDFGQVEQAVSEGAPKQAEWYLSFALLVTLAWVYFECLKLAFRIAQMLGDRR